MKTMNLLKIIGLLAFVGAASTASAASLPTSGTCAMLTNVPHPLEAGIPGQTYLVDVLAVVDFGTKQISYNTTDLTVGTGYAQYAGTSTFTLTQSTTFPSATVMSFTPTGGSNLSFNLVPTNGGNTILVQGITSKFNGVCQVQ